MTKLKIFHNTACSKSRATLELIQKSGQEAEVVDYLKNPPTVVELSELLDLLKMSPEQIVRRGEEEFSILGLETNPPKTRGEWIKLLVQYPILIERPIVSDGKRAVLGRPPENVLQLLDSGGAC